MPTSVRWSYCDALNLLLPISSHQLHPWLCISQENISVRTAPVCPVYLPVSSIFLRLWFCTSLRRSYALGSALVVNILIAVRLGAACLLHLHESAPWPCTINGHQIQPCLPPFAYITSPRRAPFCAIAKLMVLHYSSSHHLDSCQASNRLFTVPLPIERRGLEIDLLLSGLKLFAYCTLRAPCSHRTIAVRLDTVHTSDILDANSRPMLSRTGTSLVHT